MLYGSAVGGPDILGKSSGACHLSVPVVRLPVAAEHVSSVDREGIMVETPKSAMRALSDGDISMLSWAGVIDQSIT